MGHCCIFITLHNSRAPKNSRKHNNMARGEKKVKQTISLISEVFTMAFRTPLGAHSNIITLKSIRKFLLLDVY